MSTYSSSAELLTSAQIWIDRAAREGMRGLELSRHKLDSIPADIESANKLESLYLNNNNIRHVSGRIGKLKNLKYLFLLQNPIESISPSLGDLSDDFTILLDPSRLPATMAAAYRAGTRFLLAYLRSLRDAKPRFEAKIVLVGDGAAGKTTCLERLRTNSFVERATTHGIEVSTIEKTHPKIDGESIHLNFWDFGGQDVYRVTHQFFYSQDAIYILAWNPRDLTRRRGLYEWLEGIRLRLGSKARVIVASTYADSDSRLHRIDYGELRYEFADLIVGFVEIDSKTGRGFEALWELIFDNISALPHFGEPVSLLWMEARNELLPQRPQVSLSVPQNIFSKYDIPSDQVEAFLIWLHSVGRVLYFWDDLYLRNFIVTDPEWLTKAIGILVSDRATYEARGELRHDRLPALWLGAEGGRGVYAHEHLPYLLRLTERFDITYVIPDRSALSLVGELVPESAPADLANPEYDVQRRTGHRLRLLCDFPSALPGFISRFIVRTHRFTTGLHWARGVIIRHLSQESVARVEMLSATRLQVTVHSSVSPVGFFEIIRGTIESITHDYYKDVEIGFSIPCGKIEPEGECGGLFELANVERARALGKRTVQCPRCFNDHGVDYLLTGFSAANEDLRAIVERIEAKISPLSDQSILMREVIRQVNEIHEQVDCPRLFKITPINRQTWNPRNWLEVDYSLVLYCEHPEHEHAWTPATYTLRNQREWLKTAKPYIGFVAHALKYGVPIAGAGLEMFLGAAYSKETKDDFDLVDKIIDIDIPDIAKAGSAYTPPPTGREALRDTTYFSYRRMILAMTEHELPRFGGLTRVRDQTGRHLWVCPDHDREIYNPPLARIPKLGR